MFLRKDAPSDELVDTIRRSAAGQRFIDPQLAAIALRQTRNPLTDRERDVLEAAANGGTVRDIARALAISTALRIAHDNG